jgi:uncharacterized protein YjbI with pentapeptide repeats
MMAKDEHLKKIAEGVEAWNQWREENKETTPDLSGASLGGGDLSEVNLSGANLRDGDLSGANLSGANLNCANLSGANLSDGDLSGANLSGADLCKADVSDGDLSGANLQDADLSEAALSGAKLSDADLRNAKLKEANLYRAVLVSAKLPGAELSKAKFRNGDLSDADLSGANLSGANLSDADLRGAKLLRSNLSGADLSGADLSDADLSDADLSGADLDEATLLGAILLNTKLQEANFWEANLRKEDLVGGNLSGYNEKNWRRLEENIDKRIKERDQKTIGKRLKRWGDEFLNILPPLLGYLAFLAPLYYFFVWKKLSDTEPVIAVIIAVVLVAVLSILIFKKREVLKHARYFAVIFFVVFGLLFVSIFLQRGDQSYLFKLFVIAYFSFIPAWIYVQFISVRGKTLWDEYVLNLYRLHVDNYIHLPEPPSYTFFHDIWSEYRKKFRKDQGGTISDKENIYRKKFEGLFGKIPEKEEREGSPFSIYRGENVLPVVIATLLIAVSWIYIVNPGSVFDVTIIGQVNPATGNALTGGGTGEFPYEMIRFALLGAYFYVLQMLIRRYFQNDLKTSAYVNATMRFIVVILLVWVIDLLLPRDVVEDSHRQALAFVIGVFPQIGWDAIVALIRLPIKIIIPSLRQKYPLSDLDGLNVWYESRLLEEGIEDMQNLATANLVDVMLNTRIPVERLVDWVDQSILYLHLGESEKKSSDDAMGQSQDNDSQQSDKANGYKRIRRELLRYGIRAATDMDDLFENQDIKDSDSFKKYSILYRTLQNSSNLYHIRKWKEHEKYFECSEIKELFSKLKESSENSSNQDNTTDKNKKGGENG